MTTRTLPTPAQPAAGTRCRYRGRIAPTPTGMLHLGHARTFRTAWERARAAGGTIIYRQEDLDPQRCNAQFAAAAIADLRRYGLDWDEGPDLKAPGPHAPYCQSQRTALYREALWRLILSGHAYPDSHSRSDLQQALTTGLTQPSPPLSGEQDTEAIFPTRWRPDPAKWFANAEQRQAAVALLRAAASQPPTDQLRPAATTAVLPEFPFPLTTTSWRFRVPDGEVLTFDDAHYGLQQFTAGVDFGDFVLWRRDNVPAYELAVVVDDNEMEITEVVRGADLLRSTARQLLLYRALGFTHPQFYHCPLLLDKQTGKRLAKRSQSQALRTLLDQGAL